MKKFLSIFAVFVVFPVFADEYSDVVARADQVLQAARITCSGISDEIAKIANISKANTAVSAVGTAMSGGAVVAGVKKSQEEQEIERLVAQMCKKGGCSPDGVEKMTNEQFFNDVLKPMAEIAELQERIKKSKSAGNWRTGLMAGTIGTNVASAIMSGININQSDLIQHITACNEAVKAAAEVETELKRVGVNPLEEPVVKNISKLKTWCNQIDTKDIEKIEKRMKGVMGTAIAGSTIGVVGVGTSAAANSDKYMDVSNKVRLSDADKKKEKALNTTANVMAGANVVAGAVGTGLNISLITLTKKLIASAQRCEEVLK